MTESVGPVMPRSVMYAVPCGSTRSSAVWTWRCVPTTALTRPSRYQPMACDSLVASACMSTMMTAVSARRRASSSSALRKGQSRSGRKTRPMRLSTATLCGPALTTTEPTPGVPRGKFAGRRSRFSFAMYSMISFLSQMWLPEVITSTPCSRKLRAICGVTPKPAAAFSTLTMARSTSCCLRRRGRSVCTALRPGSPKTSPTQRIVSGLLMSSLRDFHRARLADDDDLDVSRVLHFGLDALGDVLGQLVGVEIGDLIGLGHDAELAPRLDRVAHLHALVRHGDLFELGQPLDVALEHVAPRAGAGRGDAVGRLGQHRLDGLGLDILVSAERRVDDLPRLAPLGQHLEGQLGMAAFLLVGERLADVVEQPHALGELDIGLDLGRHHAGQPRDLLRVLEAVLAVRGAELHAADELDELRVQAVDAHLEAGLLALLLEVLFHVLLDLLDDLLDARRMDAAVATDDAALHVVRGQVDDGHRRLDRVVRRQALDRRRQHFPGLGLRGLPGLFLEAHAEELRLAAGLDLHLGHQLPLGFLGREPGDAFELAALLLHRGVELGLGDGHALVPLAEQPVADLELALAPVELLEAAGEQLLLLEDAALDLADLILPRAGLLLELAPHLEGHLLGFELGGARTRLHLAELALAFEAGLLDRALGIVHDALGAALGIPHRAGNGRFVGHVADEERQEGDEGKESHEELDVHFYLQTGESPGPIRSFRYSPR